MLWLTLWLGCSTGELRAIPGTTTRIARPVPVPGTELELKIFTTEEECRATVDPDDVPRCLPHVDRTHGEVRLAFQLRLDSDDYPLPLTKEHIQASHLGTLIQDGVGGQSLEIVPHDPMRAAQLFVLVIDGSSSMNERVRGQRTRMDEVREALLLPEVQDAFFPENVRTGVVVLQFTGGRPVPLGEGLQILTERAEYARLVEQELQVRSGYTHLYEAVEYATGALLDEPDIQRFVDLYQAAPTIVALTDGFNNMAADDTCRTNAPRLERLLTHLDEARAADDVDIRRRPTVFTVGLGRPLRPQFEVPDRREGVRPVALCGQRALDRRIDGDLERVGIDNASLSWIAHHGGGFSYVSQERDGLGVAFQAAAAERFYWFEARYRIDPFFLRRQFQTKLRLVSFAQAESSVTIVPSAWLDGPGGTVEPDGRVTPRPFRASLAPVVAWLGLLAVVGHLGPAWVNLRRALFRRAR